MALYMSMARLTVRELRALTSSALVMVSLNRRTAGSAGAVHHARSRSRPWPSGFQSAVPLPPPFKPGQHVGVHAERGARTPSATAVFALYQYATHVAASSVPTDTASSRSKAFTHRWPAPPDLELAFGHVVDLAGVILGELEKISLAGCVWNRRLTGEPPGRVTAGNSSTAVPATARHRNEFATGLRNVLHGVLFPEWTTRTSFCYCGKSARGSRRCAEPIGIEY